MSIYTREQLENFTNAVINAAESIRGHKPAFYLVSLNGGLPLFDMLTIVDRDVNPDQAIYFPGSSKIHNSSEVMTRCFENLFLEKKDQSAELRPLLSMDEVVSGSSVERLFNSYNTASRRIARAHLGNSQAVMSQVEDEAAHLQGILPLNVFGVREIRPMGVRMNPGYLARVKRKEVLEFSCDRIITMDDPDFTTIQFIRMKDKQGYLPKIERIVLTPQYLGFLHDVARYVGKDPNTIEPQRARVIADCEKYTVRPNYESR